MGNLGPGAFWRSQRHIVTSLIRTMMVSGSSDWHREPLALQAVTPLPARPQDHHLDARPLLHHTVVVVTELESSGMRHPPSRLRSLPRNAPCARAAPPEDDLANAWEDAKHDLLVVGACLMPPHAPRWSWCCNGPLNPLWLPCCEWWAAPGGRRRRTAICRGLRPVPSAGGSPSTSPPAYRNSATHGWSAAPPLSAGPRRKTNPMSTMQGDSATTPNGV